MNRYGFNMLDSVIVHDSLVVVEILLWDNMSKPHG